MYGFAEQNFDVTNYSSVISSIAFSKRTKFFNNCLIELSLISTKSRAKLKGILSENYCKLLTKTVGCYMAITLEKKLVGSNGL